MSGSSTDLLAEAIAGRLSCVEGVRVTYAPHGPLADLGVAVSAEGVAARAVRLGTVGPSLTVSARLGTDRAVPARRVLAGAVAALDELLGSRPYALDLEIAVID